MNHECRFSLWTVQYQRRVYELVGYAAAASVSDLSVPPIWQHIQALREKLRRPLVRESKPASPTIYV